MYEWMYVCIHRCRWAVLNFFAEKILQPVVGLLDLTAHQNQDPHSSALASLFRDIVPGAAKEAMVRQGTVSSCLPSLASL
jgi:hypothetical protein